MKLNLLEEESAQTSARSNDEPRQTNSQKEKHVERSARIDEAKSEDQFNSPPWNSELARFSDTSVKVSEARAPGVSIEEKEDEDFANDDIHELLI